MGIRVKKILGYGLSDLAYKKGQLADPRINPKGYLGCDSEAQEEEYNREGYIKYLNGLYDSIEEVPEKPEKEYSEEERARKLEKFAVKWELNWFKPGDAFKHLQTWEPYESVIYDDEFGLKKVLLICPPEMTETWKRHDESIDYYEEVTNHAGKARFQKLKMGIYPYEGWQDCRTGRPVKDGADLRWLLKLPKKALEAKDFKPWGFNSLEETKKYLTPSIPRSVVYFTKYLKLFNDPRTVYQLKPMIYVYWA